MSRVYTSLSRQGISALSPASLDDQQPFSMGMWVLPVSMGAASGGRFIQKETATAAGWRWMWGGVTGTANNFLFVKGYTTTNLARNSSENAVAMLKWQHVMCVWNATTAASGVKFYVDGIEPVYNAVTSVNGVGTASSDAVANFEMGNREVPGTLTRPFHGNQAMVTFHRRILSAGEIGQLRSYPGSIDSSKQQGFWPLWSPGAGATGTSSEYDYSGNGNVATAQSCLSSASAPPINGMFVIPSPHFGGCA